MWTSLAPELLPKARPDTHEVVDQERQRLALVGFAENPSHDRVSGEGIT